MKARACGALKRILPLSMLAILGGLLLAGAAGAQDAAKIRVTTALDNVAADGVCSLREAIVASNTKPKADPSAMNCAGSAIDSISFSIGGGTPTISVTSALPTITDPVTIAGNSGGATRIILQPSTPGLSVGLYVASTAANSTVRYLWIRNFKTGINLEGAGSVLISSVVSENVDYGVNINAANVRVGGTSGTTPGGACTGDCNVIFGNVKAGIRVQSGTNSVVQGNHIGCLDHIGYRHRRRHGGRCRQPDLRKRLRHQIRRAVGHCRGKLHPGQPRRDRHPWHLGSPERRRDLCRPAQLRLSRDDRRLRTGSG
jgi:CSLREA domain-containing protein